MLQEPFATLCQRLLHLASPEALLSFLERLQESSLIRRSRDPQLAAVADVKWRSLDDALLCNACAANGRQVRRSYTLNFVRNLIRPQDSPLAWAVESSQGTVAFAAPRSSPQAMRVGHKLFLAARSLLFPGVCRQRFYLMISILTAATRTLKTRRIR